MSYIHNNWSTSARYEGEGPLRIANVAGRAKLLVDGGQVDIESASNANSVPIPPLFLSRWSSFAPLPDP
jgi:hypothetical protein